MKKLLLFVSFLTIFSCNNETASDQNKLLDRKIDKMLNQIISIYPNFKTNEIQREELLKVFTRKTDSLAKLNYLDDIPLEILKIQKNPHGKGAMVQFYADNDGYDNNRPSDLLEFDFIAFMDEKEASKLNDKEKYYVSGKKVEKLTQDMVDVLVKISYYSAQPEIEKGSSDNYVFNAGNFLCEVSKVTAIK